jgi:hypothetical protein
VEGGILLLHTNHKAAVCMTLEPYAHSGRLTGIGVRAVASKLACKEGALYHKKSGAVCDSGTAHGGIAQQMCSLVARLRTPMTWLINSNETDSTPCSHARVVRAHIDC